MSGSSAPEYSGTEIAIVGMAGRFPGARSLDEFWRNLRDGVESIRPLTLDELDAAGVPRALSEHPDYVRMAAVLDDVDQWDAGFFGFSPKDAAIMDPQHRLFLECSWEALENAGHPPEAFKGAIGVWAGCGMNSYFTWHLAGNRPLMDEVGLFLLRHTGNDKDFLATRVSYTFDLRGPSVNVQTACSTSLVAIHQACQALLSGEVDMALAGGVTIELPQNHGYLYKESEILSPDGHCRAFAADSKGTIFGSGAGVVVLRRLSDALENGDHVHAIIRGSAINNDGSQKVGYLAPSVDGQAAAVAEALAIAGVEPSTVSYVETHGTGTPVGDPIEVTALTQAFRQGTDESQFCAIGSLKTNIGHLDTAAGVAGLIKTVLAMRHRELPASLHFERPNAAIDFSSSPFFVNAARTPWTPRAGVRRAGVSSLGVGGTNAHVVLEEAPAVAPTTAETGARWELLPLSARSTPALDAAVDRLADALERPDRAPLGDVAFTLQTGRRAFRQRRVVVARDAAEAVKELAASGNDAIVATASDTPRSVAFMFAGGGAQYPGMGAELYATQPVYRAKVDEGLALLDPALAAALRPLLFPAPGTETAAAAQLERPTLALPALLLTQVATAALWQSWGVEPDAMIGHSMGEYTAAHLAGVFSLGDALALVATRGRLFERIEQSGMLSVPLSEDELRPVLGLALSLAAVNAPSLCVASGPLYAIADLEQRLLARDVECQRVRINIAAHSMMLDPILDDFRAFFDKVRLNPPTARFVSNLSGTWITADEATSPDYWVSHLRNTVRFADGLRELLRDPNRALVEVGPGRVMTALARQHADLQPTQVVSTTMRHATDQGSDTATALKLLGRLWCAGVEVKWEALHEGASRRRVPLPTYPFERQRHWVDRVGAAGEHAMAAAEATDALARQELDAWFSAPTWRAAEIVPAAADATPWRVVLLGGDAPLGRAMARALSAAGHDVTTVREGARFEALADGGYAMPADSREGYDALLKALSAAGRAPTHLVHMWTVPALDDERRAEGLAFRSVLHLAQAIAEAELAGASLLVVGSGAQQVGDEDVEPLKALAIGAARVLPRELPGLRVRHVDVRAGVAAGSWQEARLVEQLQAELADAGDAEAVALRGGDRLVQAFAPVSLGAAATRGSLLRDRGTYLVTGGLGGIGLALAEHLARAVKANLVLVGRAGLPARERWAQLAAGDDATAERIRKVRALEEMGAEVMVVRADVTDAAQMSRAVAEARARFGAVHGVLHAAGVLDDGLLQLKTADAAARVLAPKVRGTLALDAALGDEPVDFVALCSSVSAVAGLPGQVDYAAANAFLDAFARSRNVRRPGRTIAIGWSAWAGVGMVATRARDEQGAAGEGEATGHPFLERRWDGAARRLTGGTVSARHWILDEHRLDDGSAVIPGTGYVELARAALAADSAAGEAEGVLELRDLVFLTPLLVRGDDARDLRVGVTPEGDAQAFVIGSAPAGAQSGWIEHARGTGARVAAPQPAALDLAAIRSRCGTRVVSHDEVVPQAHLRFGARWDVIRQVAYGADEALLTLALPTPFAGDLATVTLHPALMDLATAGAQALVGGYDAREHFFVPVSYTRLRQHGALPADVRSHVRLREPATVEAEFVAFDVTVTDGSGRVLVDVEEFVMKRVGAEELQASAAHAGDATLATPVPAWAQVRAAASAANTAAVAEAIQVAEGVEVFDRMVARGTPAHVLVSPQPLAAAIERLRGMAVAPAAPPAAEAQAPAVDVARVEAALEEHDAVEAAGVIAHRTRKGEVKIAAFVQYHPGESATVSELRRFARGRLPDTLVPQTFEEVVELPRMASGAVDHAALPDPFAAADDFVAPATAMQVAIAQVWRDVLGIERVSLRDNFFDIGGHSLLAMRVITRLSKTIGVRIDTPMMVLQTLEQIASECEKRGGTAPALAPALAAAPADAVPTAPAVEAVVAVATTDERRDEAAGADEAATGGVEAPAGVGRRLFGAFKQKVFTN